MQTPPLVKYKSIDEYRSLFENMYCKKPIITFDGIPVYFRKELFDDCMFESSDWQMRDNILFSMTRAERINWIGETLKNPASDLYFGWDRNRKRIDHNSRVAVAYDDFVVVVRIKRREGEIYKAKFRTAYLADYNIKKIRSMPGWQK